MSKHSKPIKSEFYDINSALSPSILGNISADSHLKRCLLAAYSTISVHNLSSNEIYPSEEDTFKALRLLDINKLKLIIITQEPYINEQANGIPFSLESGEVSEEFQFLIDSLEATTREPIMKGQITPEIWLRNGILLLSTSLTSQENSPKLHTSLWFNFLSVFLYHILRKVRIAGSFRPPIICLGKAADEFIAQYKRNYGYSNRIIRSPHPQYYIKRNLKVCDVFSQLIQSSAFTLESENMNLLLNRRIIK